MKIGIVGNGFVGKASQIFARSPKVECLVYDIDPLKCNPIGCTNVQLTQECDLIFICVPTPMNIVTGRCDISIVKKSIEGLLVGCVSENRDNLKNKIIVRSTVPPGTCAALGVSHMPEYLTEKNWEQDFINSVEWHLGSSSLPTIEKVAQLLKACYDSNIIKSDNMIVCSTRETEAAKYFRNAMLSVKLALCNEFADYCNAIGIDYANVRELIIGDPRIGASHTQVPGPDGVRGFGGTCLPKDLSGLITAMEDSNTNPSLLKAAKTRNETIDRPKREWLKNIGRTVSSE